MKSLKESILAGRSTIVKNNASNADDMRCLAYYVVRGHGSSYGPMTGFDLFNFLKSKPLGADAKPFKADRLHAAGSTDIFNYYKCTGEHNSHLCAWLLKQLVLVVLYSKFKNVITKDSINQDLKNLSNYFTQKYAEEGEAVVVHYTELQDKWVNEPHTGFLSIYVTRKDAVDYGSIGSHCSISYVINLDK